jgi:hypothetical protein
VHSFGDSLFFVRGLLAIQLVLAVLLIVGYRTRLVTLLTWVLFVSLLNRNIYATDGGDQIASFLLFIACFLPLGACWSVDAALAKRPLATPRVKSFGTVLLILQLMLLYVCAGIAKLREPIWWNGNAMDTVLRWTEFAKPLADPLRAHEWLTRLMTYTVPWTEILAPLLFVFTDRRHRLRTLALLAFALMHLGIDLTLRLSFFSAYCFAGLSALAPSELWDWLEKKTSAPALYLAAGSAGERWLRRAALVVALCSAYSVLPAIYESKVPYPSFIEAMNNFDYGYQNWNLFRDPNGTPGWFRAKATLRDGRTLDLFTGESPYSEAKPKVPSAQFASRRWMSFIMHAPQDWEISDLRGNLARYLAKHWNERHSEEERVSELTIVYYREDNPPFRPSTPLDPYDYAIYEDGRDVTQPL